MIEALVDFLEQRLAAAVFVPGKQHVGIHAEGRAGAPQRQRRILAIP
jgi:hypothetical protein